MKITFEKVSEKNNHERRIKVGEQELGGIYIGDPEGDAALAFFGIFKLWNDVYGVAEEQFAKGVTSVEVSFVLEQTIYGGVSPGNDTVN